uniref:DUF4249 domain-containing protein n=1 Tax=Fulvivirga sp. TaxID=1931237 RepID=UPI00404B9E2D
MKYSIILIIIILGGCIDPFIIPSELNDRILAIDGMITTEAKEHEVRLIFANQYTNTSEGNRVTVKGADVTIVDENGIETILNERILVDRWYCIADPTRLRSWYLYSERYSETGQQPLTPTGIYLTPPDFKAIVGSTYTLKVQLSDGLMYESQPQTVLPTIPIENVEFKPFREASINPLINAKGIELLVSLEDNPNERDFYLWNLSDSYLNLQTEADQRPERSGGPLLCCNTCYIPDLFVPKIFNATSDIAFNGLSTTLAPIRIADNGLRFKKRFRVRLNQYNISEQVYSYLKLVRQQLEIQGSVFDPLPANIKGNIKNISNPEQQVLGIFIAADVSSEMIYVNREDIPPAYRAPIALIYDTCEKYCGGLQEPPKLHPPNDWEYN